jgi:hypothetical protein
LEYMGDTGENHLLICEAIVRTLFKYRDPEHLPEFENVFRSLKHNIAASRITMMTRPIEQQILARLSEKEKEIWLICLLISELYIPQHDADDMISKDTIIEWITDVTRIGLIEIIIKALLGGHI